MAYANSDRCAKSVTSSVSSSSSTSSLVCWCTLLCRFAARERRTRQQTGRSCLCCVGTHLSVNCGYNNNVFPVTTAPLFSRKVVGCFVVDMSAYCRFRSHNPPTTCYATTRFARRILGYQYFVILSECRNARRARNEQPSSQHSMRNR